jgi:hypothetical protein
VKCLKKGKKFLPDFEKNYSLGFSNEKVSMSEMTNLVNVLKMLTNKTLFSGCKVIRGAEVDIISVAMK